MTRALADIALGEPRWIWPALAIAGMSALTLWLGYRRAPLPPGRRWPLVGLKAAAFALLIACLIEPLWTQRVAKPGANVLAVLVDDGAGMRLRDPGAETTRAQHMRQAWQTGLEGGWLDRLGERFRLRRYAFGDRLRQLESPDDLRADAPASAMASALHALGQRYRQQPLAGVVVLSDGNATDAARLAETAEGLPPVYPVLFGAEAVPRDLSVAQVTVEDSAFEDAPVTVRADVKALGMNGRNLRIELLNPAGEAVQSETRAAAQDEQDFAVRFKLKPEAAGLAFYRVRVAAEGADAPPEITDRNNVRLAQVDRGGGPYRVLYVTGKPNWEYKFLRRALSEDDQVHLVGLIRVADREPRFAWRGRSGETSNPLFRGFEKQNPEEAERYDQPVLVRLDTRDAKELAEGFPKTEKDLFAYDALILDDLEAGFFSADQQGLIERFVSERGGGFLMLGGADSFRHGRYARTPIARVLPVYLDRPGETDGPGDVRLDLTRDGWLQPWARLRATAEAEQQRLAEMPGFKVFNRVAAIKPGARVLATARAPRGTARPALITHRFGAGRAGALAVGDLWRWGMRTDDARQDRDRFWRQTVRWLLADVPGRVELRVQTPPDRSDGTVNLRVRVRDERHRPSGHADVDIVVTDPSGKTHRLPARPDAEEAGLFEVDFTPLESGGHRARAAAHRPETGLIGEDEAGWVLDRDADEHRHVRPNRAAMQALAERTGGRVIRPDELDDLAELLPRRAAPITEIATTPLWHRWPWFAAALACLGLEWTLRRRRGLP